MSLFKLHRVGKSLAGNRVLKSIDLTIPEARVTSLVGPSGSGKSTLLRLLNRLIDPDEGLIEYRGRPLDGYDILELRREAVLVPQDGDMFPGTVEENVLYASYVHGHVSLGPEDALRDAGLDPSFLPRDAEKLSSGERKRVAVARALTLQPRALLLDEPTAGVDPRNSSLIEETVLQLRDSGTTVVWVTHEVEQAKRVSDQVANLKDGKTVSSTEEGFSWREVY